MPLLFPEGSIGGDRSSISIERLRNFYEGDRTGSGSIIDINDIEREPGGSNGFAIAPSRSASGNALLLINPHTTFYFRSEVHVVSEEGLNVYGAVTWGQFFIYQGFNATCGWMHTTARADALDEYAETILKKGDTVMYKYDTLFYPFETKTITLSYKEGENIREKKFTTYRTHHGPVVGAVNGKWITSKMLNEPLAAITQSFMRTKSRGKEGFLKWMEIKTNTSNGTTFVDKEGNIAYWHGNFVPRRNPSYDWSKPVDGSIKETEWNGAHDVKELVQIVNPPNGWIQNCNSTPFTGAGKNSPKKENYPTYMAPDAETPRAINAVRLLDREKKFTLDKLIAAAYDNYLASFEVLLPPLFEAFAASTDAATQKNLKEPIGVLRAWDNRSSVSSEATTLATYWATQLRKGTRGLSDQQLVASTSAEEKLNALTTAMATLTADFGTWKIKWGEVNRYQRLTGNMDEKYDDSKPSIATGLASSAFGSLPSFGSQTFDTKKRYGTVGNSFVCVVEFGQKVSARSIVTGGQSSNPASKHFTDQAENFLTGKFKDVYFYREDIEKNAERTYHPGE
jgi:acyl-homoserine lactone acylase PvdQ